jgi:hypothetical protein
LDIALAVHFYEAILATLAIIIWHFYHVIFDPDVYPLNFALVDGKVSEEVYKEEHELDYDRLRQLESNVLDANQESEAPLTEPNQVEESQTDDHA